MAQPYQTYRPDQYPEAISGPVQIGANGREYAWTNQAPVDTSKEVTRDNENGKEVNQYGYGDTDTGKFPWIAAAGVPPVLGAEQSDSAIAKPWWKRRRIWIPALSVLVLVIVAVVVGCVVGLRNKTTDVSSPPQETGTAGTPPNGANGTNPNSNIKSLCRGTTCPQLFTAERFQDQIHLFARGQDDAIWTRVHDGKAWAGDWVSLGGKFQSQPDSMVWGRVRSRMSVLGVASNGTMMMKYYNNRAWDRDWFSLNATTNSPVTSCFVEWNEPFDHGDLYARSPVGIEQGLMRGTIFGEGDEAYKGIKDADHTCLWETFDRGGSVGSSVAVVCRESNLAQDMIMYQRGTGSAAHLQWKDGGLTSWTDRGGAFAGEPVLVSLSLTDPDNRVDFFGTSQDRHIHHFTWSKSGNYTPMEDLGGSFQSVPAVVVTTSGRLDVLALGTDDLLKHRAYIGGSWASEWEDLGVFSNSAPYAVALSSSPYQIGVFILGKDNDVQFATWDVAADTSWKKISKFESLQGKMTGAWMQSQG